MTGSYNFGFSRSMRSFSIAQSRLGLTLIVLILRYVENFLLFSHQTMWPCRDGFCIETMRENYLQFLPSGITSSKIYLRHRATPTFDRQVFENQKIFLVKKVVMTRLLALLWLALTNSSASEKWPHKSMMKRILTAPLVRARVFFGFYQRLGMRYLCAQPTWTIVRKLFDLPDNGAS